MTDAIIELLKERELDKISISEITDKAGVGRASWFRNFSSKSEAITYKVIGLWYTWCDEHNISKDQRYTIDNAIDFFNFSYKNKDLFRLIYNSGLQSTIYDAFYQVILKQQRHTPIEYYKSRFLSYGVYGIVNEWMKRDFLETPEELALIIRSNVKN